MLSCGDLVPWPLYHWTIARREWHRPKAPTPEGKFPTNAYIVLLE